jgi:hypothetical protein
MSGYAETDLYEPVKNFLSRLGYAVNAEVKSCDVTAVKDDELIIVELKTSFNVTLLYQAIERQSMTPDVYVAIPRPRRANDRNFRYIKHIVSKLGLGLMTVALDSPLMGVEVVVFPEASAGPRTTKAAARRLKSVLNEIRGRTAEHNVGGSTGKKINTAYRERCIKIACAIEKNGDLSAKELVGSFGCEKDAYAILYKNQYGWFERVGNGRYGITERCRRELEDAGSRELVEFYRAVTLRR